MGFNVLYLANMVHKCADKGDFTAKLAEAGDKLVVVDFFAVWCGPCKRIAPELEAHEKELGGAVLFLKVDVDECEDVAAENEISCMPTFIFFKNGAKVDQFSGADMGKIKEKIQQLK